jgi:hypothetical protein
LIWISGQTRAVSESPSKFDNCGIDTEKFKSSIENNLQHFERNHRALRDRLENRTWTQS